MGLGWIFYKSGDPDLGVEYFLKSTSLDPKIAHSEEFTAMLDKERFGWQVYNHLGWAYYFKKDYKLSIAMFQIALETRPRSSEAMKGLGYNYFRLKKFGQAEAILKKCIKRNPNTHPVIETRTTDEPGATIQVRTSARTMLANILYQQEKYQEALAPLLEELERHPDWAEVHNSLGWTYIKLNRLTQSRDALLHAIQQQPLNSPAHKGLRKVKYLMALKKM
jgi:tetratricopeptide (TPR) repeat protein